MTPRERVLAAIEHRQPDVIPIDFSGHRSSGIAAIAYARLKKYLGITSGDIYVYDMIQQLAIVEPEVLDRFGTDTLELGRGFLRLDSEWRGWVLPDGTPCKIPGYINPVERADGWCLDHADGTRLAVQKHGSLYFEQLCFPLMDQDPQALAFEDLPQHLSQIMWCSTPHPGAHFPLDQQGLRRLTEGAQALRAQTDRAIVGLFGGNLFELGQWLFRIDGFFMHLISEPQSMHRCLDRLTELHLANLEKWLGAVGPFIDVIVFGDDLGMQTGPQISPAMYREFFKPRHALLWRRAKQLSRAKVMLHSCGSLDALLPDLIDAGLDAVNPVQINCAGMEAGHLKRTYGKALCFWGGGCDTRAVLPNGAPDEIRRHVRDQVSFLAPGGGFVFQQVHNILSDVPPENIVAMFEAVRSLSPTSSC